MKIILTLTLALFMTAVFGQTEMSTYKNVSDKFEKFYNAEKYDSIFSMFSKEMQGALPVQKTKDFFINLNLQAGKIQKREFVKYNSTYAIYKTQFDKTLLALNISVDNDSKINGLLVNVFKGESLPKIEINKTKISLPFKDEWTVVWEATQKN